MSDTILAVILTGCFTAVPATLVVFITNRREERKQRRDLAVQISMEMWRRWCLNTDSANKEMKFQIGSRDQKPFDDPSFMKLFEEISTRLDGLK